VACPIDVQDMEEKVPIKLDTVASRKSRKPDRVSSKINVWISMDKRGMNGYEIWMLMDKKGYMTGYERIIMDIFLGRTPR
jgi:hypothetical protein